MIRLILVLLIAILYLVIGCIPAFILWLIGKKNPDLKDRISRRMIQWIFGVLLFVSGTKVKAYVVLRPGVHPSDEVKREILRYCEKHIAKYAMPYDIEFREELPKTLVGKVAYRKLEEEANAQHVA